MYDHVLSAAFAGCGRDLSSVRRSPEYARELRDHAEHMLGNGKGLRPEQKTFRMRDPIMLRHLVYCGSEVRTKKEAERRIKKIEALPQERFSVDHLLQRADISMFGKALMQACARKLPDDIRARAQNWDRLNSRQQKGLVRRLYELLLSKGTNSIDADRISQTAARVLPSGYRKIGSRHADEPNCLGKAQLLAAFGTLAGADMLMFVPLADKRIALCKRELKMFSAVEKAHREGELSLSPHLRKWLREQRQSTRERIESPAWLHAQIAFRLKNGKYLVVDPNFGIFREYPAGTFLPIALSIEAAKKTVPGLVMTHHDWTYDWGLFEIGRTFDRRLGDAKKIASLRRRGYSLRRIIEELGLSNLTVLDMLWWSKNKDLYHAFSESHRKSQRKKGERNVYRSERLRQSAVDAVVDWLAGKFDKKGGDLSRSEMKELADGLANRVIGEAFDTVHGEWAHYSRYTAGQHFEVMAPEWGLACATLAHIAVVTDQWEGTEPVLVEHCQSQFRLFHSALLANRRIRGVSQRRMQLCRRLLAEVPIKTQSSQHVVRAWRQQQAA